MRAASFPSGISPGFPPRVVKRKTVYSVFPGFLVSKEERVLAPTSLVQKSPCTCLFLQVTLLWGMEEAMDCLGCVVPDTEIERSIIVLFVLFSVV